MYSFLDAHTDVPDVLILHTLFSLEALCIAEALGIPCVCLSPSQPPYSCPPALATALQQHLVLHAPHLMQHWDVVVHWLWPLCTERWGDWRQCSLGLPAMPCWRYTPLLVYGS